VTTTAAAEVVQKPIAKPVTPPVAASTGPAYAQMLVTSDQKTADALAAKLIDHGFMTAYVERAGATFKVRVKFASESEARASEAKLKELSKDVWIVK
jgi:cell division septation protein DedD